MIKKILIKLECRVIRYILKKVLTKSRMLGWVNSLLYKLENLSENTIIDNEVAKHIRMEWNIPRKHTYSGD